MTRTAECSDHSAAGSCTPPLPAAGAHQRAAAQQPQKAGQQEDAASASVRRRYGEGFRPCVFTSRRMSLTQSASQLPPDYSRRATLLLLRLVAAAAAFAAAAAGLAAAALWLVGWRQLLVLLVAAEAAFAVHYRRKHAQLSAQPAPHAPPGDRHQPLRDFERLLELSTYWASKFDARVYLSTWFCGADYRLIRRDNVAELIAYGFWYKSRSEMEAAGLGPLLRQCVSALECAFRISLPSGHQPGLRCMYHLWEPLRTIYRPLAFYAATEALALLTQALLLAMGCSLSRQSTAVAEETAAAGGGAGRGLGMLVATAGLERCRLPEEGKEKEAGGTAPAPVLLLHGIGLGLLPYVNLIRQLLAAGLPLVAVEYKHVSMRLCSVIPSADDIALAAAALLSRLGVSGACVVAHSYGTFVASRLAQLRPDTLQSLALLDPVCFGMFMPHLLANFIYRQPRASSLSVWAKDVLFNFVSRDLHCAAALCRRFYWSDVNLWPQDLPGRTLVVMGARDHLVHVIEVVDTLMFYAARIMFHPGHAHMQMLVDTAWMQQVVVEIRAMATAGSGAAGAHEVERRLLAASSSTATAAVATAPAATAGPAPAAAAAEAADAGVEQQEPFPSGAGTRAAAQAVVTKAKDGEDDANAFAPLTPVRAHKPPRFGGGGGIRRTASSNLPPLLASRPRPRLLSTASTAAAALGAAVATAGADAAADAAAELPAASRTAVLYSSPGRRGLPIAVRSSHATSSSECLGSSSRNSSTSSDSSNGNDSSSGQGGGGGARDSQEVVRRPRIRRVSSAAPSSCHHRLPQQQQPAEAPAPAPAGLPPLTLHSAQSLPLPRACTQPVWRHGQAIARQGAGGGRTHETWAGGPPVCVGDTPSKPSDTAGAAAAAAGAAAGAAAEAQGRRQLTPFAGMHAA